MKVLSIQVGRPQQLTWEDAPVLTSIVKHSVTGPVRVGTLNLAGDEQSDLTVHGGAEKAVYAYPSEHYPYWREQLPEIDFPPGAFGENLTTEGLIETALAIGDQLHIGTAQFVVTQPRLPCYKLGVRFQRRDMVKRFFKSDRMGFYLRVVRPGTIAAGDAIELRPTTEPRLSVADVVHLYTTERANRDMLRRASQLTALPAHWRERFRAQLG